MYVAIDQKPENGCEIQNAVCGDSGIMIQIKLVKSKKEEERIEEEEGEVDGEDDLNHGTTVLLDILALWYHSDCVVCADSYFASKQSADELMRMGLRFIGVVKTATKKYPMGYLSKYELQERGDFHGVVSYEDGGPRPSSLAFVWMDR